MLTSKCLYAPLLKAVYEQYTIVANRSVEFPTACSNNMVEVRIRGIGDDDARFRCPSRGNHKQTP